MFNMLLDSNVNEKGEAAVDQSLSINCGIFIFIDERDKMVNIDLKSCMKIRTKEEEGDVVDDVKSKNRKVCDSQRVQTSDR